MENTYTEADLVKFGQYLLSKERKSHFKRGKKSVPRTSAMAQVWDADIANFNHDRETNPDIQYTESKEIIYR